MGFRPRSHERGSVSKPQSHLLQGHAASRAHACIYNHNSPPRPTGTSSRRTNTIPFVISRSAWDHRHWWRQSSKDYPSDANHWSVGFDGVRDIFPCTTAALPTNLRSLSMGLRQSPPLLLELQVIVRERILYLLAYVTSSSLQAIAPPSA